MDYNLSSADVQKKAQALKELLNKNNPGKGRSQDRTLNWFGFPSGDEKVTLRILPVLQEGGFMMVRHHYKLPGDKMSHVCLQTNGLTCPLCEVVAQYRGRMETTDWEAQCKVYVNGLFIRATDKAGNVITLLDRNKQPYKIKVPYLVPLSEFVFQWFVESLADPEKGDVSHPVSGRNVTFQRSHFNGPFKTKEFAFQSTPIGDSEDEIKTILTSMTNPSSIWRTPDDDFYKKTKDVAEALNNFLIGKLAEATAGLGGTGPATHPRAVPPPTQAQTLGNPSYGVTPPVQPVAQPVAQPQVAPAVVAQAPSPQPVSAPQAAAAPGKFTVPAGAPVCFADAGVFNAESNKCMICNFDYHCQRAINASKQA